MKTTPDMHKLFFSLQIILAVWISNHHSYAQTTVTFRITNFPEDQGENVGIRGNTYPLDWGKSILTGGNDSVREVTLTFPQNTGKIEFKFVTFDEDQNPTWENISNRELLPGEEGTLISQNIWNQEPVIDIQSLDKIQPEELLKDFELIKTMVLEVHPGTFRYNDQQAIDQALSELKSIFEEPLTYGEAYLAMSKLTAAIKCDHTKVGFNNQNILINSVIHYQKDKLPFTFKWIEDKMVVIHDASENQKLKKGAVITRINGTSVEEIRDRLLPLIAADGATDKNRLYKIQIDGYDFRYNAFDIFFPLAFPLQSDTATLEINLPGQTDPQTVQVQTQTREIRSEILEKRYPEFPENRDEMWNFEILEDSIGLLRVNSYGLFGWKAMEMDYKAYLEECFQTIQQKQISHLIIDIRENTGGADEMKDELFSYLNRDQNFTYQRQGRTRYLDFPESLKPHVQTWGENPWFFNLKPKNREKVNGYYIFIENKKEKSTERNPLLFKGKVYLLTSPANTSLAFYTAYQFQKQSIGIIIGEETGGNLNDINGGQILFLRLPNSKIEIDFPVMGAFALGDQPNSGVIPDVVVRTTYEDIIQNRDPQLAAVLRMIAKD